MSCLEQIFTGILNNRLASLSDEIGLLTSVQAGFRNAHSTADNIFIWTFIKNKVKQFKIYWNHKLHSICLNIHW
jgi:hypothetical protein